jgi:hypothetical protein
MSTYSILISLRFPLILLRPALLLLRRAWFLLRSALILLRHDSVFHVKRQPGAPYPFGNSSPIAR